MDYGIFKLQTNAKINFASSFKLKSLQKLDFHRQMVTPMSALCICLVLLGHSISTNIWSYTQNILYEIS